MVQNYANHRRYQPIHHFIVQPVLAINLGIAVKRLWDLPTFDSSWTALVAFTLLAAAVSARQMALRVQDRVIRLEMRQRLERILPAGLAARIGELRARHLVGLRFAGDAELPRLVERCLSGELNSSIEVKKQITDWQPDLLRA